MADLPKLSDGASIAHHTADASFTFTSQTGNEDVAQYMQLRRAGNVYDSNAQVPGRLPDLQLAAATVPLPMDGALSPLQKPLKEGGYQRQDWTSPDGKVTIPVFMPSKA